MLLRLCLILLLLLLVPLVCRRLRVPSIVGLILAGMAVGPHGLALLPQSAAVDMLGRLGMLYIMFLSGIEIDLNDFRRSRFRGAVFGLYTFFFPFLLGILTSRLLGFGWPTCLLMGSLYGSHTLMTYPVVSRYGIQKNAAVNITVGGTMLAVTLSLLLLGGVSAAVHDGGGQWWVTLLWLMAFLMLTLWAFPRLTSWFVKRYSDPSLEFLLVISLVVAASWLAEKAGLEGILGAFVAGVALNRRIPNLSPLMSRITFMGNTFFIPLFLLGVGMMIDVRAFLSGWGTLLVATVMLLTKLSGKWLASLAAQLSFRMPAVERRLLFGLTSASAAGTLAVVTIGYTMQLFSVEVLNASVILILVSCIAASFTTEAAARRIARAESFEEKEELEPARVLIPVTNSLTAPSLMDLALFTQPRRTASFVALSVIAHPDDDAAADELLRLTAAHAAAADRRIECLRQVAANTANGIQEVIAAQHVNCVVAGVNMQAADSLGSVLEHLTAGVSLSVWVYHEVQPLNTLEHLRVAVPRHAELESGFMQWFEQVRSLAAATSARVTFYAGAETVRVLGLLCRRPRKRLTAAFVDMPDWEDALMIAREMQANEMLLMVSARRSTVSWNPLLDEVPGMLQRFCRNRSFLIIFPAQSGTAADYGLLHEAPAADDRSLMRMLRRALLRQWRKRQRLAVQENSAAEEKPQQDV
ncbi:MAG: cation:proton antiporter [Paludibacteraceae bacterium]|nr:cation:proton antiporter [Paludibacteraceae bacterium]